MDAQTLAIVLSTLATAVAGFAGYVGKQALDRASAAKISAETESVYIQNAEKLVGLMQTRVDKMQEELNVLQASLNKYQADLQRAIAAETANRAEILKLQLRIEVLEHFIQAQGLKVPPSPE